MKVKSLFYALCGVMVMATSCSDTEFEAPNQGTQQGPDSNNQGQTANTLGLVNVYADENGSEESLLAGNILVKGSRTLDLNVPAHLDKVYMKYTKVSGGESMKEFALSPSTTRAVESAGDFDYATSRIAAVTLWLPEDAVQPTDETDAGYLFYHNTGVVMFEDGWPTQPTTWYDEDFNDVVFEYDLKVTECQDEEQMAIQGSKEELLLTLDVRAVGGRNPTKLGVVLENLDKNYIDRITAKLLLKGGQGMMWNLGGKELSTDSKVVVDERGWQWGTYAVTTKRTSILTVDTEPKEGTVITLNGLNTLRDEDYKDDFFQVTPGKIETGLPMLRAEIRLIGKEGLSGIDREKQLSAFRNLILDTRSQNFFIETNEGKKEGTDISIIKEIHLKGYEPTSAYKAEHPEMIFGDYTNTNGYTWGVKLPVGTKHAYEREPFKKAYPKFEGWIESNGASNKDWYLIKNADEKKLVKDW